MDFCEAIESRRLVEFTYDGHPRVVIPAAYGRHGTTGNPVLRAYQAGGPGFDSRVSTQVRGPLRSTGRACFMTATGFTGPPLRTGCRGA